MSAKPWPYFELSTAHIEGLLSLLVPHALHVAAPTVLFQETPLGKRLCLHEEGSPVADVAEPALLRALLIIFLGDTTALCTASADSRKGHGGAVGGHRNEFDAERARASWCRLDDPVVHAGSRGLFLQAYAGIFSSHSYVPCTSNNNDSAGARSSEWTRESEAEREVLADRAVSAAYQALLKATQSHWPWEFEAEKKEKKKKKMEKKKNKKRSVKADGKLRVGVISSFLGAHSVGRLFFPMVAALDPSLFELHVLSLSPTSHTHPNTVMQSDIRGSDANGNPEVPTGGVRFDVYPLLGALSHAPPYLLVCTPSRSNYASYSS